MTTPAVTDTDGTVAACGAVTAWPEQGETHAPTDLGVTFTVEGGYDLSTLRVSAQRADGATVAGTASTDGSRVRFVPTDGFERSTEYRVILDGPGCLAETRFVTQAEPVTSDLGGRVWYLSLVAEDTTFVHPAAIEALGALADHIIGNAGLLVYMAPSDGGGTITLYGAGANDDGDFVHQDTCIAPFQMETGPFFDPAFAVENHDPDNPARLETSGVSLPIYDATLEGEFTPDGTGIRDLRFSGSWDITALESYDICGLIGEEECMPCSDTSTSTCAYVEFVETLAEEAVLDREEFVLTAEPCD